MQVNRKQTLRFSCLRGLHPSRHVRERKTRKRLNEPRAACHMHLLERIFRCKPIDTFSTKRNLFANKSRKKNTPTRVGVLPSPLLWDWSGVFCISSLLRISLTSFPTFRWLFVQSLPNTSKKMTTDGLESSLKPT